MTRIDGRNPVTPKTQIQPNPEAEKKPETVDMKNPSGGGKLLDEDLGLAITREDVKAAQDIYGIKTSKKTKERVANMHNEYVQRILSLPEDAPVELKAIAIKYAQELPKAAKGSDILDYQTLCETKLEAFRSTVRDMNMGKFLEQMEQNADDRFVASELAADARADMTNALVENTGDKVIKDVNEHSDENTAKVIATIKQDGAKTRGELKQTEKNLKRFMNSETNRGINENNKNMNAVANRSVAENLKNQKAIAGYGETDADGRRTLTDGTQIEDKQSLRGTTKTVGAVLYKQNRDEHAKTRAHVSDEHAATRANSTQNAKETQQLSSKRQAISDTLAHEGGTFRDSTVKWLNGAADRIMKSSMPHAKKLQAMDELARMIDEEFVITDGDKENFNKSFGLK